jgi:hypothetical protein
MPIIFLPRFPLREQAQQDQMSVVMEQQLVIYEISARKHFSTSDEGASASFARMCQIRLFASKFVQYFLKRTLCLIVVYPL